MHLPDDWVDELAHALDPDAFDIHAQPHLSLTHRMGLAQRLSDLDTTLDQVRDDLRNGFTSDRRNGRDGDYYCLSTSRFDVFVSTQPEEQTGAPLAVITSVKPVQRLARREELASPSVSFHLPYEQQTCDIAVVHQSIQRQREQRNRQNRARDRAADLLGRSRNGSVGHSDLHSQVRRQYSSLLTVIDLLKERNDAEGFVRMSGTFVEPSDVAAAERDSLVCIELDRACEAFRPGMEVTVESGKREWRLDVVNAEDTLLCLEPPERDKVVLGDRALVEYQESFRLAKHSYALNRFLDENVVGDWTALARLVCAPEAIATPTERSDLTYYDSALNKGQREAVAGAVDAPHAFFVQGPPGTGKTTVITEIVRQLVARGERVLLVASMHVAVDEVLRRVAEADGVFALRYSSVDSKVRDDMRRFMPDHVTAEFAKQAARPTRSKADRWQSEIDVLSAESTRIRTVVETRAAVLTANRRHAESIRAREQWQSMHGAAMAAADSAATQAKQQSEQASGQWSKTWRMERALAAELATATANQSIGTRLAGLFGKGSLMPLRQQHHAVHQVMVAAHAQHQAFAAANDRAAQHQQATAYQGINGLRQHDEACKRAAEDARAVARRLTEVNEALRTVLDGPDPTVLVDDALIAHVTDRQARVTKLKHYLDLERQWHEIVGLIDQTTSGVEKVLAEMGDELLQAANLVCCTATGFAGQPDIRDTDFDTVIIDEASRVIDSEFLISARQARRWILVGDEHQLPPYVHGPDEQHLHALAALHMIERDAAPDLTTAVHHLSTLWREDEELHRFRVEPVERAAERLRANGQWERVYRKPFDTAFRRFHQRDGDAERALLAAMRTHLVQSLFERCVQACPPELRTRLTEQRRMIDPIAAIVRDPVYDGNYTSPPPEVLLEHGVSPLTGETLREPVVLLDTSGQPNAEEDQSGTGFINKFEARWAVAVCRMWERELRRRKEPNRVTTSVLTLYGAQAKLLRSMLGHPTYPDFRALKIEKIDSIDAIQGQESDLVLLSFCRTRRGRMGEGFGLWLQDVRRLNVACTRARRSLVLIGHRQTLDRLSTVDEAKVFYGHLFGLFDQNSPGTVILRDLRRSV